MTTENKKRMWLKEFANSFGMDIAQLAKYIGYAKISIYAAACGTNRVSKSHIEMACFKLGVLSEKILRDEIQSANERHEARLKAIRDFEKRLTGEDE